MDNKNRATSTVTIRPRLSLSTRQIGQRIKSEEGSQLPDYNRSEYGENQDTQEAEDVEDTEETEDAEEAEETEESSEEPAVYDGKGRIELTKNDLLRLLAMLEGELQAKDIALAVLRCEQLKRLTRPIQISKASILKRYNKLQEVRHLTEDTRKDRTQLTAVKDGRNTSPTDNDKQMNIIDGCSVSQSKDSSNYTKEEEFLTYNETLELIEQNPLLALSKDSVYIYDYDKCDVQSTKNYLNFKIHHLENLINQHRQYRLYMNERLRRSEKLCFSLTRELEKERKRKIDEERNRFFLAERSSLLHQVERFRTSLEEEKSTKQKIVLTLINELLDEREKRAEITRALSLQNSKVAGMVASTNQMVQGLKSETERSLMMEAELETIRQEMKKQAEQFDRVRDELKEKLALAESKNIDLTTQLEQQQMITSNTKADSSSETVRSSPVNNRPIKTGQTTTASPNSMNFSRATPVHPVISSSKLSSPTRTLSTIQRSPPGGPANNGATSNSSSNTATMVRPAVAPPLTNSRTFSSVASRASSSSAQDTNTNTVRMQSSSPNVKSPISQQSRSKSTVTGSNSHLRSVPPPIPANKPQIPAKPAFVTTKRTSASNINPTVAPSVSGPITSPPATINLSLNSPNSTNLNSSINNNNNNVSFKVETTEVNPKKFTQNI